MKFKTKRRLVKSNRFIRLRRHLKGINFIQGQFTLYEILFVFFKKVKEDDILERANAVAFSFTIALFPAVIFLFALVPMVHKLIPAVDSQGILDFISSWIPSNMYSVVESTITDIL